MTDATLPNEGVSTEIASAETPTVIPTESTPAPAPDERAPQETARDAQERRAVERVRALRQRQAEPAASTEPATEQPATEETAGRPRDERGRFAPKDAEPQAEPTAQIAQQPVQTDEARYKVKVDGRELELPISEILKGYQLEAASRKRLDEAAQLRREAEALRAQAPQPETTTPAEPEVFDPMVKIRTADGATYERPYSDVMAYGTPEEIRQAETQKYNLLREQFSRPAAAAGLAPDQIMQVIRYSQVRANEEATLQKFLGEYPAIVNDPDLATIAVAKATRLMTDDLVSLVPEYGPQIQRLPPQVIADRHAQARFAGLSVRSVEQIFGAAAQETAQRFGAVPATGKPAKTLEERTAAKASAPQPVQGANARQAPTSDAPVRKTRADIIRAERQARGFAP